MLKLEIALRDQKQEEIAAVVRRVYYLWDIFQHQNMAHTVKMSKTELIIIVWCKTVIANVHHKLLVACSHANTMLLVL